MAAINSPFYDPENGWMAMDQIDPALLAQINGQGITLANPGGFADPNSPLFEGMSQGLYPGMPQSPSYTAPGGGTNTPPPSPSPSPSPNPTYPTGGANSLPMGSENVGGMGMYTGANAPLDTTRFTPATNQANVWYQQHMGQNPGNVSYMQFADELSRNALNAAGGQWTGGDSIATQQQYLNSQAGQQWMSNLRSRGQQQPTQLQQPNPAQYSGPQPPLPQQPQPFYNPAMPSAQPSFNPAMAYQLPQVDQGRGGRPQFQNPFGLPQNPFTTMQNPGMGGGMGQPAMTGYGSMDGYGGGQLLTDMQYQGQRPGIGSTQPSGGYGQQPGINNYMNMGGQQNLQQMIAYAMSQGALGGQQGGGQSLMGYPSGFPDQGAYNRYSEQQAYRRMTGNNTPVRPEDYGYTQPPPPNTQPGSFMSSFYNQQQQGAPSFGGGSGTQPYSQQQSWSSDPGMSQSRAYDMYGGGGQQSAAPQADFRAATFGGGGGQQAQQTQAPSFSQQFSAPQSSTSNASNPWGNVSNRLPSLSNSYNYMWGR